MPNELVGGSLFRLMMDIFSQFITWPKPVIPDLLREKRYTHLPPTLVIQPGEDANVPEEMTLNLLSAIQEQDGNLVYRHMPNLPHAFAYELSEDTVQCSRHTLHFIEEVLGQHYQ